MKKKMFQNFCVMIFRGGRGIYAPMGIFPDLNIHKNIDCHLKT